MRRILALWVPLVALQACLPVNRPDAPAKSRSSASFSSQPGGTNVTGGGTRTLTGRELLCSSHAPGSVLREPCLKCVDAIVGMYCTGNTSATEGDPAQCPAAIQGSMGGRINQCLAFHQSNGYINGDQVCARSCSTGLMLNVSCQCVVPAPPNFGGNNGQPGADPSQYNNGAPVSRAVLGPNLPVTAPLPYLSECSLPELGLRIQVVNRSMARVQDNVYSVEGYSIRAHSEGLIDTPGTPVAVTDQQVAAQAQGYIPALAKPDMYRGNLSLGQVERFSGTAFVRSNPNPAPSASPIPPANALWSTIMGHMDFGQIENNNTQWLYVADTESRRIRKIGPFRTSPGPSPVPSPSVEVLAEGLQGPYGIAVAQGDVFQSHIGNSGIANSGRIAVRCASANSSANSFCVNAGQKVIVDGISTPGGLDVLSNTSPGQMIYVAQPNAGKILAFNKNDLQVENVGDVSWVQNSHILTFTPASPETRLLATGDSVLLAGNYTWQSCSNSNNRPCNSGSPGCQCTSSSCSLVPGSLDSTKSYYVVNYSGTTLSLSETWGGPPISITTGPTNCPSGAPSRFQFKRSKLAPSTEFTTAGLIQPTDVQVITQNGVSMAYVTDGVTGLLHQVTLDPITKKPVSWSPLNSLPPEGTPQKDEARALNPGRLPETRLIRPMAMTVVDGTNLLISEGTSPDPVKYPGGSSVRLYCSADSPVFGTLCAQRGRGFYRVAGAYLGLAGAASNSPITAPMDVTFAAPSGIAVSFMGTAYLASGGADSGIFRLSRQYESQLVGIKYGVTDAYGNKASQCLRFHTAYACDSGECRCRAIPPMDRDILLWSAVNSRESCTFFGIPALDTHAHGLVGYWTFDEATGMRWADSVAGQHLTPRSSPPSSELIPGQGKIGNSSSFTRDRPHYADTPLNDLSTAVRSLVVSAWVSLETTDLNQPHIVAAGRASESAQSTVVFKLAVNKVANSNNPSATAQFEFGTALALTQPWKNPDTWHHLLAVASDGVIELYVDGVRSASVAATLASTPLGYLKVGGDALPPASSRTRIDELAMWQNVFLADAAARQALATALYKDGAGRSVINP